MDDGTAVSPVASGNSHVGGSTAGTAVVDPTRFGHSRDFDLNMLMELKAAFDEVDVNGDNSLE